MSGILIPSGRSNFFDYSQHQDNNGGSGINSIYPSPSDFSMQSGLIKTYPTTIQAKESSGIFSYYNLSSRFSNAQSTQSGVDFYGLNDYIHYFPKSFNDDDSSNSNVNIPYISTYKVSTPYNPYGRS